MSESSSAAEFVPDSRSLRTLRQAAADCRGCPLWQDATQTVFAEAILRLRDHNEREDALAGLVEGLRFVAGEMAKRA
jgi:hypothetical protein